MPKLTEDQQKFLVRRRANCVEIPDITKQFKEEYGLDLEPYQISAYDATTVHGRERMGKDLQVLFWKERRAYMGEDNIAIGKLGMRLREYEKMYLAPTQSGLPKSDKAKLAILEQVAKEVGGLFRQRVSEADAEAFVLGIAQKVRDHIETHVSDPKERNRLNAAIKEDLEE